MGVGTVWLLGAGPGDPGLIAARGLELLARADVVLFDARVHPALLDACASAACAAVAEGAGGAREALERLIEASRAGKRVVRLCFGDPLSSAAGAETALALAASGIPFEVVPGVSSCAGSSAYAGIALGHRELSASVSVVGDALADERSRDALARLGPVADTLCASIEVGAIEAHCRALLDGGRPSAAPAALIWRGARPGQRVLVSTLGEMSAHAKASGLDGVAVLVVGEVVALRERLRWFDNRPLFGKRVLVPRAAHQAEATARSVRERAAEPVVFPVIEIAAPPEPERLVRAGRELRGYDWVVFTSANGVERFFEALEAIGSDARAFADSRIAVIGPKTGAALSRFGLRPDLVAEEFVGEGVAKAILERGGAKRVLIPRALVARETLPEMLRSSGAEVDVVPAYETKPVPEERAARLRELFERGELDVALFSSGSTVTAVLDALGPRAAELLARVTIASIGPITSKTLHARGIAPTVTASVYTVSGLLDALEEHFGRN